MGQAGEEKEGRKNLGARQKRRERGKKRSTRRALRVLPLPFVRWKGEGSRKALCREGGREKRGRSGQLLAASFSIISCIRYHTERERGV